MKIVNSDCRELAVDATRAAAATARERVRSGWDGLKARLGTKPNGDKPE
jgi:hypothetical protein